MLERPKKRYTAVTATLFGMLALLALAMWGCGTSGYDNPNAGITTTQTPTALIEAATLKQWVDEGKVNNQDTATRDKVVVLEVTTSAAYATSHIPGSLLMNSGGELTMTRLEGVAPISTMILDGNTMDTLIKKSGINGNTTVVFSVSKNGSWMNIARAYFTFRYWGFPKERLKVLNGGDNAWEDAGNTLDAVAPTVAASTYSVRSNAAMQTDLRYSIGQMIKLVDDINLGTVTTAATGVSILDVRGGAPTTYVANATVDDFAQYGDAIAGKTTRFKSIADLTTRLTAMGVTSAKSRTYVYCASGMRAAVPFFVLDGVMGWPVTMYDGSWNQWSAYTTANLPNSATAAWRIDTNTSGTTLPRTTGSSLTGTLTLDPASSIMYTSITDPRANQILNDDVNYFNAGTTTTTSSGGSSGGSSSGC